MTGLSVALEAFHFLRPFWLLCVPIVALIWWIVRRSQTIRSVPTDGFAPHLRDALTVGQEKRRRLLPIDGVAVCLILLALGSAGPTWSRQPDPFVAQSAPLVIALKVTGSMEDTDVAPSRLERGKQKIRDLLDLRAGARTALVAYAGTAHGVVPMTGDPGVMVPYLEGLAPDIMPVEGSNASDALAIAEDYLAREETPGGVLFVADSIDPADVAALDATSASVAVLTMLPDGAEDRGINQMSAPTIGVSPDDSDVRAVDKLLDAAYRQALLEDTDQPWLDRGLWLAWPAALIMLLWFRRGWTMRWSMIACLSFLSTAPSQVRAEGPMDWFLTLDQQGQIAFNRKNYDRAAELFVDPMWRGFSLYRDGQYEEAIQVLSRVETAEAAFVQGMAAIKSRSYRDGVRAFQTALARDPDFPNATENLAVAEEIVVYIEDAREQSDTGEEAGIGADDVVFDNEAGRGAETQIEAPEGEGIGLLSTDEWMNTVDTRTGDFLRQRFAIEAAQGTRSQEEPVSNSTSEAAE